MVDIRYIAQVGPGGSVSNLDVSDDALILNEIILGGISGTRYTEAQLNSLISNSHVSGSDNQSITAGSGLTGGGSGATVPLNVGQGDGILVNADDVAVDSTVLRTTQLGVANGVASLDSGGQVPLSQLPSIGILNKLAGEAFSANVTVVVRYAISGETAGRIYKLDPTDNAKSDPIGLVMPSSALSPGDPISVVMVGEMDSSVDFTASQDEGLPVFVGAAGAPVVADPGAGFNLVQVGMVSDVGAGTSVIGIQAPRLVAIRP